VVGMVPSRAVLPEAIQDQKSDEEIGGEKV